MTLCLENNNASQFSWTAYSTIKLCELTQIETVEVDRQIEHVFTWQRIPPGRRKDGLLLTSTKYGTKVTSAGNCSIDK